jgi:hypothetical protein
VADGDRRSRKVARIAEIRAAGFEPRLDVVRHGLEEQAALLVEAALIDCLPDLTNAVAGHGVLRGRAPLDEYVTVYGAEPVPESAPPAMLVRLGRWRDMPEELEPGAFRSGNGFRSGMTLNEIVDSTRAWWRVSPESVRRRDAGFAVAVHNGVTRAVMEIGTWTRRDDGRYSFTAEALSAGPVWEAWVGPFGRRVSFVGAAQNPITYWPR